MIRGIMVMLLLTIATSYNLAAQSQFTLRASVSHRQEVIVPPVLQTTVTDSEIELSTLVVSTNNEAAQINVSSVSNHTYTLNQEGINKAISSLSTGETTLTLLTPNTNTLPENQDLITVSFIDA